ncbi:methionine--tRNA ligase [Candidatus Bathyarchaeota archaeon]|nr:methionine--tRNA ligase [Candidatus Bathyarchaeota archaeon]
MKNFVVTAALPYANDRLHLGHLRSTYIPADIYVRYFRLKGENVIYICATDEHGTPITIMAEKAGTSPKEVVNEYHEADTKDFEAMGISFTYFGRTTLPLHYELTQEFFLRLREKGHIYESQIQQLYCIKDDRFLPDRFVEGICPNCHGEARGDQCENCGLYLKPTELVNPRCALCGTTPIVKETKHWFFRLSSFQDFLKKWIQETSGLSSNVRNYAAQWLKGSLNDWCITRDMDWGVPVPVEGADGKVIYVWFDAPIGYVSNTIQWARDEDKEELWRRFWQDPDGEIIHFIGKDIIYHHALFWPAMLKGRMDYSLPTQIIAGEYLTLGGKKMSKSKGWMIEVKDYLAKFEADPLRYYLTVVSPLNRDADFTWEEFARKNNDELADILGNFIHRTLVFTYQSFDGKIPVPEEDYPRELLQKAQDTVDNVGRLIESHEYNRAMRYILNLAASGNKFFNDSEPWRTIKTDRGLTSSTLYIADQLVKILTILMAPFLPTSAEKLWQILNLEGSVHQQRWSEAKKELRSGHTIKKPSPLFRKIEAKELPRLAS